MEGTGMSGTVELFVVNGDKNTLGVLTALQELGFQVIPKGCPPSTAEWVPFPVLRDASGSSYYGEEGIRAFVERTKSELSGA